MRPIVERLYSTHVYPAIQAPLTHASNLTATAWLDGLLVIVLVVFFALLVRDVRRRGLRGIAAAVVRGGLWALALSLLFVGVWGLNYQRVPLSDRLRYDAAAVTVSAVRVAANASVDQVNALHDAAHASGWGADAGAIDPSLAAGFAQALSDLHLPSTIVVGRPKRSLLDWYFRRAGVSGMTDPFFLETLESSDLLPFERPFVTAHEWSHLAGIADEGDANFVGWLACVRGSSADRYSGWLFLSSELVQSLRGDYRVIAASRFAAGPREDLRAIDDRVARHVNRRVANAGWTVYDSYLRANRVEGGAASYAHVVRLVAGTAFDAYWRPKLRDAPP